MAPPSSSSRRLIPWASDSEGGELSRPRNRWQSVVLQIKGNRRIRRTTGFEGLFGFRQIKGQEFMRMLLPVFGSMVQRVVSEEIEKALRQFTAPRPPRLLVTGRNQRPRYQLKFLNGLKPVYTMSKLESDEEGMAIKVAVVETLGGNNTATTRTKVVVRSGYPSSAKVEVVVLHGHFNSKNEESWTPEEFNRHIVSGRDKSAQLLTGNLTLKLSGGEAVLDNATFTDNSSFTSTKMFRLGLRLLNASGSGERVLEGVTEPFRVKERRVEGFEKHHPPMPDDEVWRLEKIRKNGPYHQALSDEGIDTVQELLQAYMMDEQKLLKIFSKMPQSTWKSIIGHAMTCKFGNGLYLHEVKDQDVGLFFDAIYQLVGVKFGGCYKPIDQLDQVEKNLAESLKRLAYHNMGDLQYNYKMVNNQPVLLQRFPTTQGTSMFSVLSNNLQISSNAQHNSYLGDTLGIVSTRHSTSNVGLDDITRFVQGQTFHDVHLSYEPTTGRVLPHNSRITQLQIPQTQTTDFGPDPSALLPIDSESFSNHSVEHRNGQSVMQSQQAVTGFQFQASRTNSFDDKSFDELLQSFKSQISYSEPLSPRKWVKIRAALKLASVGRLSRRLRRGSYYSPPRPRLVSTL